MTGKITRTKGGKLRYHSRFSVGAPIAQTKAGYPAPEHIDNLARQGTPRTRSTLDNIQEAFRSKPTKARTKCYLDTALEYWFDEMIGDEALLLILHEMRNAP